MCALRQQGCSSRSRGTCPCSTRSTDSARGPGLGGRRMGTNVLDQRWGLRISGSGTLRRQLAGRGDRAGHRDGCPADCCPGPPRSVDMRTCRSPDCPVKWPVRSIEPVVVKSSATSNTNYPSRRLYMPLEVFGEGYNPDLVEHARKKCSGSDPISVFRMVVLEGFTNGGLYSPTCGEHYQTLF